MLKGDAVKHLSSIGFASEVASTKPALERAANKYGVDLSTPKVEAEPVAQAS